MVRHQLVSHFHHHHFPSFLYILFYFLLNYCYFVDPSSHFIVPELGPDVNFSYASHKAVSEYKEAKAVCFFSISFISCSFRLLKLVNILSVNLYIGSECVYVSIAVRFFFFFFFLLTNKRNVDNGLKLI